MIITPLFLKFIRYINIGIKVKKSVPTWFRYATEEDVATGLVSPGVDKLPTPGIIETLEGPVPFSVDDVICKGWVKHELWPMTPQKFAQYKLEIEQPIESDWGKCENKNFVFALRIPVSFTIDLGDGKPVTAKANDLLIYDEGSAWPLAQDIFPESYKLA